MKRKVIQLAGKTLVVSLPSAWAKRYQVRKGDEVEVEERDRQLVIGGGGEPTKQTTKLSLIGLAPMVKRVLGAIYKSGYDEVEVAFETPEFESAMELIRDEFIGFETVYKGTHTLTIRNISSLDPKEFDAVMRRMILLILQIGDESILAIEKRDASWLKAIIFLDKDVNKYADFCRRVLNKHGADVVAKTAVLYYIVEQLERISDCYKDICKHVVDSKTLPSPQTRQLYRDVTTYLRDFYELYYQFDLKRFAEFGKKHVELSSRLQERLLTCCKADLPILHHIYTLFDNTFDMNGALLVLKL